MYALLGRLVECSACLALHGMPGGLCPTCVLIEAKQTVRNYEGGNDHADQRTDGHPTNATAGVHQER